MLSLNSSSTVQFFWHNLLATQSWGIFIAKTLLEHTGATITFRNRVQGGAEVEIVWPRVMLEDGPPGHDRGAAGKKQQRAT